MHVLDHPDGRKVSDDDMVTVEQTLKKRILKVPMEFVKEKKPLMEVRAYLEVQARSVIGAPHVKSTAGARPATLTEEELQLGYRLEVIDLLKEATEAKQKLLASPIRKEQIDKLCVRTGAKSREILLNEVEYMLKSDIKQNGALVAALRARVAEIRRLKEAIKALLVRYTFETTDTAVAEPPPTEVSPLFAGLTIEDMRTELNKEEK